MAEAEVLVVGGGPAGAALTTWLAERGRRVVVLDRARFPRDKACGECLSPGAVPLLRALGVADALRAAGAVPYRGLRLVGPDGAQVEARYPAEACGYTLSRIALDAALLDRARQAPGVAVREGTAVAGLWREPSAGGGAGPVAGVELASGERLRARLVVGADGRFSTVRRLAFGPDVQGRCDRYCFVATYEQAPPGDDWLECLLCAPGLQCLRIAQGEGRTAVCLVVDGQTRDRHAAGSLAGFAALVAAQPRLAEALAGARLAGPLKGMPMARYQPPAIVADGVALVGDAVGFMDPITGEGMGRALASARLAAATIDQALAAGDGVVGAAALAPYARAFAREFDPVVGFVELAVRVTTLPSAVVGAAVRTLAWLPPLAEAIAATQGALLAPADLWRPWRWPALRPGPDGGPMAAAATGWGGPP